MPLIAQEQLQKPLNFVSADSIIVWGEDITDLRGTALRVDRSLEAKPFSLSGKSFRKTLKTWKNRWLPLLTPAGLSSPTATEVDAAACSQMLNTAAELFLQSGHADFMEITERTLLNDLIHYIKTERSPSPERRMAAQTLLDGMGRIYATDEEGIYVNLFVNSTTTIRTPHVRCVIDQLTALPFENRLRIRLTSLPKNGHRLKLRLRCPRWATDSDIPGEAATVITPDIKSTCTPLVNGRDILQLEEKDGYFVIDRAWNNGDEVLIEFPLVPRLITIPQLHGTSATLRQGPLLYTISEDNLGENLLSRSPLQENADSEDYPLIIGHFKSGLGFTARPYAVNKGWLWTPCE